MAGFIEEVLRDTISIIMPAVKTGLAMAGAGIAVAIFSILFWTASSFLGRPWGVMMSRFADEPTHALSEGAALARKTKLEVVLAGAVGVMMWTAAFIIEGGNIDIEEYVWTIRAVIVLIIKTILEALVAIFVTGRAIRIAGLG